jgi:alkyl hydroperoxide reductase subunit AhpC
LSAISDISINDLPVGRNVDEYLRLVEAFQFADEHGEVCPVNWKKGEKTMKDDPKASLEYFKTGATEEKANKNRRTK